ncbi:uncharacterized protein A4U43_C01F12910 [Asparagus officinalis]|uniref:Uncharacterized protein n=1 Tax=Asparagus officinalis TaxID=4686 RepID=A0A5P1FSP3_ASPOF|nr:uncharacterized protein A4U43_C01F12910 [Asparagus officinalis]
MRKELSMIPMQEPMVEPIAALGKEPVPLEQEESDDEEMVECEAKTDTYLIDPNDTSFEDDISSSSYMPGDKPEPDTSSEVAPMSILADCEPALTFASIAASSINELDLVTSMVDNHVHASISTA